jgi:hypothetical protein
MLRNKETETKREERREVRKEKKITRDPKYFSQRIQMISEHRVALRVLGH